jgi:hypothetical protein
MAITTAVGISTTTVTTDQQAPLGFELVVPTANAGEQTWIYVQANGALTLGMVCSRGAGVAALTYDLIPAPVITGANGVVGVAVTLIPDNNYGFIMKKGFCSVVAGGGSIDVDEVIIVGAGVPGRADCFTAGAGLATNSGFGWATANAATAATAVCYVNCVG